MVKMFNSTLDFGLKKFIFFQISNKLLD